MLESIKSAIANILIVVLCLGMVGAGMIKLMSLPEVVQIWQNWGLPTWFRYVIGAFELVVGLCIFIPATRKYAILALTLEMLGALTLHLYYGEYWDMRGPILILSGSVILWVLQKIKL